MTELRRKCHAIIFDLDGVLVHTDQFHFKAWKSFWRNTQAINLLLLRKQF